MIGIYAIKNKINSKIYIGKSSNIEKRKISHKYYLTTKIRNKKCTNRYLYDSVQKYGWDNFEFIIIETFTNINEDLIKQRELYWMEYYQSTLSDKGYNLRMDSSTKMIVHESTKAFQRISMKGKGNPNYNNKWTLEMKEKMSQIAIERHKSGLYYDDKWKKKQSVNSTLVWSDKDKCKLMAKKVRDKNQKYNFYKYNLEMNLINIYQNKDDILIEHTNFKMHNIYSVCSGKKKRIYGFVWKKELKIKN